MNQLGVARDGLLKEPKGLEAPPEVEERVLSQLFHLLTRSSLFQGGMVAARIA